MGYVQTETDEKIAELIHRYIKAPYQVMILELKQNSYYFENATMNTNYEKQIKALNEYIQLVQSIIPSEYLTREILDEFRTSNKTKKMQIKTEFKKVLEKLEV